MELGLLELILCGVRKMIKIEHNAESGERIEIELTPDEIAKYEEQWAKTAKENQTAQAEAAAKEAARQALLDKLGITAEEAQLLLGGK